MNVVPTWTAVDIFIYINEEDKSEKRRHVSEPYSLVNDTSDFFAESDNGLRIRAEYFLRGLHQSQGSSHRRDTLLSFICIITIFSITFLSLDNQQNNKSSAGLQHVLAAVV